VELYFRIYAGTIKKEQVVDFLKALVRHLDQPLLIVWDRLPGHRSRLVQDYIAGLQGWISTAYLPPYAPELNPVEYGGSMGEDSLAVKNQDRYRSGGRDVGGVVLHHF
jgi:transposase